LEAFRQLKPVTYAYKAQPHDAKVGFIAEEVPELVADPQHRSVSAMDMVALLTKVVQVQEEKITKLEAMQKKVAQMEAILTNLALETSAANQETLSAANLK